MNVFVTGTTGVIGRRVVPLLVAAGHRVTGIGRTPDKRAALDRMGAKAVEVSLFDPGALRDGIAGHDAVINLATHMPPSTFQMFLPGAWSQNDRVRRQGSANLVDAAIAAGATRFIQESFAPVYPERRDAWIDESVPLDPVRVNRSIVDAERSAERFTAGGRDGVILRFAAFYGPDARHLRDMVRLVRHGLAPMPGPAGAYLSSVSHDDAATAVVAALRLPAGAYNVADDEPLTHREYFDSLATAMGVRAPTLPPAWLTPLFGDLGRLFGRSLRIANRKLRAAAGWAPRYHSARDGWPQVVPAMPAARETSPGAWGTMPAKWH